MFTTRRLSATGVCIFFRPVHSLVLFRECEERVEEVEFLVTVGISSEGLDGVEATTRRDLEPVRL
jgi:hypothetical protein